MDSAIEGPRSPRVGRWPRRALIAANVAVATILVCTGLVWGYARYRLDSIKTGSSAGLSPTDGSGPSAVKTAGGRIQSQSAGGLQPENILLIGNETRAGQTQVNFGNPAQLSGTLSDIIMVLHLDPKDDTASVLSIPRDVFSPMPADSPVGAYQKIDAALNDGANGPNNLATAITQDYGIPINHYVEVAFDGFLNTVNALGGIKLDFPERLYDAYSNLQIDHTGCQLINGVEALALVRSRHLQYDPPGVSANNPADWPYDPESDLARIVRDHTFIRVLASTGESEGLTNPLKINAFLSAVLDQLTVDPGLKNQLVSLIEHYHNLNPFVAATTTIPVTQVTGDGSGYVYEGNNVGDVEFPDEPADTEAIEKWDPSALPAPVEPASVSVYNIAGAPGLAASTGTALRADGINVTTEANGVMAGTESETVVQYHPGQLADAMAVFDKLSGAVILQSVASVPSDTVAVQAGATLAVHPPASAPTSPTTASSTGSHHSSTPASTAPTPGGQTASASADQETPYDPRPC
jgi:LCP family protein required for cell wall assembly